MILARCKRAAPKGFWRRWIRLVRSRRNRTCRPMPISDLTPKHHSQTPLACFDARKSLCARSSWESIISLWGSRARFFFFPSRLCRLSLRRRVPQNQHVESRDSRFDERQKLVPRKSRIQIMGNLFYWAPISLPIARLPASTKRTAHHNTCCSYKQSSCVHTT